MGALLAQIASGCATVAVAAIYIIAHSYRASKTCAFICLMLKIGSFLHEHTYVNPSRSCMMINRRLSEPFPSELVHEQITADSLEIREVEELVARGTPIRGCASQFDKEFVMFPK